MKTEIISITKPIRADLLGLTPEEFIVYQARISNPENQSNHETGPKLLSYCLKNCHWSIFEMVDVTFEIETSRAIMAQVLRHHSFRFQEFSQRYSKTESQEFEDLKIRIKHLKGNRQGSGETSEHLSDMGIESCLDSRYNYCRLIDDGAAPESARMVLPLATATRAYMKGSVRSWITYFWQRRSSHAQKEHRDMANSIFNQFSEYFPICSKLANEGEMQYVSKT
jgi:thymidylate synthase (FAD)